MSTSCWLGSSRCKARYYRPFQHPSKKAQAAELYSGMLEPPSLVSYVRATNRHITLSLVITSPSFQIKTQFFISASSSMAARALTVPSDSSRLWDQAEISFEWVGNVPYKDSPTYLSIFFLIEFNVLFNSDSIQIQSRFASDSIQT
ncbi:hypothetical protein VN97_g1964 [Penicillium thymicola]|uniref:Uncharacterized protein n=1 Tax=Penicillium thymicola TaxID=293382 RepID=A0AAI9TQE9_PENTH|nr:hypothetical protein VN97_g1964 [Penicillium thymicola]